MVVQLCDVSLPPYLYAIYLSCSEIDSYAFLTPKPARAHNVSAEQLDGNAVKES